MFNLFQNIHIDWLGKRRVFIAVSIVIMLAGLISAVGRQFTPGGSDDVVAREIASDSATSTNSHPP